MTRISRLLACLVTAGVLAGLALAAAPSQSNAAVLVGVGDQNPATFTDPLFDKLNVKRTRNFTAWNVALKRRQAAGLDTWLDARQGRRREAADLVQRGGGLALPAPALQAAHPA